MDSPFPSQVLHDALHWAQAFGDDWRRDVPDAPAPAPEWAEDLRGWIADTACEEARGRTTRAMRRLRRTSPREYEVLLRTIIYNESFEAVTAWLNERARRNNIALPPGKDVHYSVKDAVALFICGIETVRAYW